MKSLNLFRCFDSTIKWLAGVLTVLVLAACGGGGGGSPDLIAGHALPNALYSTAPASLTLTVGATQTFTVGGGTPLYKVSSSNPGVIAASVSGSNLTVKCVSEGSATITVFDQIGSSVSFSMTVGSGSIAVAATPFFATAPSTIKLAIGEVASFNLSGGTAPYFQSSSQAAVTTGAIDAGKLTITGRATGSAEMSVFDSAGNTLKISVNVGNLTSTELYMTAPSTISMVPAAASTFSIGGGSAPYTVSSSNTAVATASISGNSTLAVSANSAGTAQIVVFDSTGKSVATTLTVASATINTPAPLYVAAPGTVTLAVGATSSYSISGGTAPYTVSSSNASVVSASGTATTLALTGVASGAAQVVVFDALGLSVTVDVTVTSATSSLLSVLPSVSTAMVGDVLGFALSGGSGSYSSVTVNNASIAAVGTSSGGAFSNSLSSLTSTAFFAKLLNVGTTTVAIVDSQGQSTTLTLIVTARSSVLGLSPSALQVGENSLTPIVLNIYGGTAPYSAFTDDLQLSSVSTTNTALPTLTIGLGSRGNRCITPYDSAVEPRNYVVNGIYSVTVTVVDSLGASATSVLSIKDSGNGVLDTGCP